MCDARPGRFPRAAPGRILPGAARRGRAPRAAELILALTAVALLAVGCLHLLAALSG